MKKPMKKPNDAFGFKKLVSRQTFELECDNGMLSKKSKLKEEDGYFMIKVKNVKILNNKDENIGQNYDMTEIEVVVKFRD